MRLSTPVQQDLTQHQQELIQYLPLLRRVAARIAARHPGILADDLVSVGTLAFLDASERYDANSSASLMTYVLHRIRGAMLDEVRQWNEIPVGLARRISSIKKADRVLTRRLGHAPSAADVAAELDVDIRHVWRWQRDASAVVHVPLEAAGGDAEPEQFMSHSGDVSVLDRIIEHEDAQRLEDVVLELPAIERNVLALYYSENLTLKQVGVVLGLSESRISQLRTKAIATLRAALQDCRAAQRTPRMKPA